MRKGREAWMASIQGGTPGLVLSPRQCDLQQALRIKAIFNKRRLATFLLSKQKEEGETRKGRKEEKDKRRQKERKKKKEKEGGEKKRKKGKKKKKI